MSKLIISIAVVALVLISLAYMFRKFSVGCSTEHDDTTDAVREQDEFEEYAKAMGVTIKKGGADGVDRDVDNGKTAVDGGGHDIPSPAGRVVDNTDEARLPNAEDYPYYLNRLSHIELSKLQALMNNVFNTNLVVDGVYGRNTKREFEALNATDREFLTSYKESFNDEVVGIKPTLPEHVRIGVEYLGLKEIAGAATNPIIDDFHKCSLGRGYHDDTAWCGSVMCRIFKRAGYRGVRFSARALAWLNVGQKVGSPMFGAVAVKRRYNRAGNLIGGHVGIVVGASEDLATIYLMGGNQDDAYNVKAYPAILFSFMIPDECYDLCAEIDVTTSMDVYPIFNAYFKGNRGSEG